MRYPRLAVHVGCFSAGTLVGSCDATVVGSAARRAGLEAVMASAAFSSLWSGAVAAASGGGAETSDTDHHATVASTPRTTTTVAPASPRFMGAT